MPIDNYARSDEILREDLVNVRTILNYFVREGNLKSTDPAVNSLRRIIQFMEQYDTTDNSNVSYYSLYQRLESLQKKVESHFGNNRVVSGDGMVTIMNEVINYLFENLQYTLNYRSEDGEQI